nr:hypothetical protein [Pseudoxanthomonas sp.]
MTDMRTGLVIAFLGVWLGACGDARADSCGKVVHVDNRTSRPVVVVIKSSYGSGFGRPDPNDFAPQTHWRPGTMPFVSVRQVPLGPGGADNVFLRTLCRAPDRRHWINGSYSIDGVARVSGQENLMGVSASIIVEPANQEISD